MNQYQAACAATALLLYAGSVHAQDVASVPAGQDQIIPVRKGDRVPFDGQLFDNDTSLRWANWLIQYKNLVKNNKDLDQKICQADVDLQQRKIDLMTEEYKKVTAELEGKLKDAQVLAANTPWYQTFTFGLVVGIAASAAVGVGTAALVHSAK